jgi:hypothetical protein
MKNRKLLRRISLKSRLTSIRATTSILGEKSFDLLDNGPIAAL